jgi:hypothetical protein
MMAFEGGLAWMNEAAIEKGASCPERDEQICSYGSILVDEEVISRATSGAAVPA